MNGTIIVEPRGYPGYENMAMDYLLLRAAREEVSFLRLYRWDPPCLSFGRHEPARRRYDLELITAMGLDTVRRPTGGRAVWHEHEVTYAVAGPTAAFGSLAQTYIFIHEMLARALRNLGVAAELAPRVGRTPGVGSGACFAAPVGGEVVVGGLKLVGSAQAREGDCFLQHGSILLRNGQDVVTRVSQPPGTPVRATSLENVAGKPVSPEQVTSAITDEVTRSWPGDWRFDRMPATASATAPDFSDPAWTWRR